MRLRTFVVILVLVCGLLYGVVQASSSKTGSFVLFLAGTQAGREDYWLSETEFKTEGTISIGGQSLRITSSLKGGGAKQWAEYAAVLRPGASFGARFEPGKVEVETGPLKRIYPLQEHYVVLDNNVFAHYEQVLDLVSSGQDQVVLDVVVPSLVLANQNPVIQAEVKRMGEVHYQIDSGETVFLEEYVLTMPGNLQIRLLGRDQELISFEIPMQGVQVVRDGFEGLHPLEVHQEEGSFIAQEFSVQNGAISLAGTLALPTGEGPFPAVLLNSGSGPQDRKANSPPVFMTNMFSIMAEKLTAAGFAVLCYDERGVGESTGDYDAATLEDLLSDIRVLLQFLEEHPQIDNSRMGMLGHSEGAYFAPIFADRLQALVLLAGPSITLDAIMDEQLEYQLAQPWLSPGERAMLEDYRPLLAAAQAEAREGKAVSQVLPINLDWLRQHMELNPLETLAKVQSPVLIVHGEQDLKVMPYHAEELAKTLLAAGNDGVTVRYLAGTTHEFTFFPYDNPNFDPLNPLQLNPELFEVVVEWLEKNL